MIKSLILASLTFSCAYAGTGTDLLLKNTTKINDLDKMIQVKKSLELNDTFLVQSYGALRAAGIKDRYIQNFFDLVFDKNYLKAIKQSHILTPKSKVEEKLVSASRLYVLWKLQLPQTFFNAWLKESSQYDFLNTELGIALDQIISPNASKWLIDNSIFISKAQKAVIDKLATKQSKFNHSVQAYRNLRRGDKSFPWISNLETKDPLRTKLAESVILDFAKKGKLGEAAKVLKDVFEPVLADENDTEKISAYYLLLARLLYQAKAYEASKEYYSLIPDESKRFLPAKIESLWISMRQNDHSVILGDLKTLELSMFKDKFLPELFLVSSMANLQLCQFLPVQKSFSDFISVNKKFAKEVKLNLESSKPSQLNKDNFYINQLNTALYKRELELNNLVEIDYPVDEEMKNWGRLISLRRNLEIKQEWKNRQRMLEITLKKMRFVKVEFLSTMRRVQNQLAQMKNADTISTTTSALDKSDKIEFDYDGVLFGDELFNYTSKIKNLCLQGKRHE